MVSITGTEEPATLNMNTLYENSKSGWKVKMKIKLFIVGKGGKENYLWTCIWVLAKRYLLPSDKSPSETGM